MKNLLVLLGTLLIGLLIYLFLTNTKAILPPDTPPLPIEKPVPPLTKAQLATFAKIDTLSEMVWQKQAYQNQSPVLTNESKPDYLSADLYAGADHNPLMIRENVVYSDSSSSQNFYSFDEGSVVKMRQFEMVGLFSFIETCLYYNKEGDYLGALLKTMKPDSIKDDLDTVITQFHPPAEMLEEHPNDRAAELLNAIYTRGDYALQIEEVFKRDTAWFLRTSTFGNHFIADFRVDLEDETFRAIRQNPVDYKGKIIQIERFFYLDRETWMRRNAYFGGKVNQ